jgi:hypothetical protein
MKRLGAIFIFIAFLMPFTAAHATLITADSSLGPATAVLDTSSGLEWLKVSVTRDMSVNQVLADMASGGSLEGFHYATGQELVCGLYAPNIFQTGCVNPNVSQDVARVQAFLDLFGVRSGDNVLYALIYPPTHVTQGYIESFEAQINIKPTASSPVEFDSQRFTLSMSQPEVHWLVRQAQAVPEPSTLALLGLGVIALATLRKEGIAEASLQKKPAHSERVNPSFGRVEETELL